MALLESWDLCRRGPGGLIKEGFFADITIFDPQTISDKATYSEPAQLSQGVKYVFVNGLEFEGGHLTEVNAGDRPAPERYWICFR